MLTKNDREQMSGERGIPERSREEAKVRLQNRAELRRQYLDKVYRQEHSREMFLRCQGYIAWDLKGCISSQELYQQYRQWCGDQLIVPCRPRALLVYLKKNQGRFRVVPTQNIPTPSGTHIRGFWGLRLWEERDGIPEQNTHDTDNEKLLELILYR